MKRIRAYLIKNMEHFLILVILVVTLLINFVLPVKTVFLNFYYLPVIVAGYYLGYRKAILQAFFSTLYVVVYVIYSPQSFGLEEGQQAGLTTYLHVAAWAGFLIIAGAIVGRLADRLSAEIESRRQTNVATIDALAMALDFRDQSTSGHSRRVANLTVGIARKIGVAEDKLVQIEHGALLHDIGKLKIPDLILWKPAKLTAEEWDVMRQHAVYGYEFVRNIDFLKGAAEIVWSHHEKFDGSGYPRGVQGTDIPLGARVFAIVDAFDAMVFDRPYHKGVSFEEAAAEIRRCAGAHFDPMIVEPAIEFLSGYTLPTSSAQDTTMRVQWATPRNVAHSANPS